MYKKSVLNIIDKYIIKKSLLKNKSLLSISRDLRSKSYRNFIHYGLDIKYKSIDNFLNLDVDKVSDNYKYAYHFITHSKKRLNDISWIIDKNLKYNDIKLYKLILLKERLEKEKD